MKLFVDIKKQLPGFTLDVSFDATSDALGLLGPSGAGKSMTLKCIAGLVKPDRGRIVLNNRVLYDSAQGINIPSRDRKIGFLFQNYALFSKMTVAENIGFALQHKNRSQKSAIIQEKIAMNKLEGLENRYPAELSGGQQQRVALARALAVEPEVLLLDEPFSALDEHLRLHIIKQLMDTLEDYEGVTIFVTHNIEEAYRICRKLVVLKDGRLEAAGGKEELFKTPPTLAAALITGYKNFSSACYVAPHELEALDWGVRLKVKKELSREDSWVGIRAHYIRQATARDRENVFNCWPVFTSETPFRMTVYLTIEKNTLNKGEYHLQWEVTKEKWLEIKDQKLPWSICLDPETLVTVSK